MPEANIISIRLSRNCLTALPLACRSAAAGLRRARGQHHGHPLRLQGLLRPQAQARDAHAPVGGAAPPWLGVVGILKGSIPAASWSCSYTRQRAGACQRPHLLVCGSLYAQGLSLSNAHPSQHGGGDPPAGRHHPGHGIIYGRMHRTAVLLRSLLSVCCSMVEEIHLEGGTILGTSRGLPNVPEIVKRLGECLTRALRRAGALHPVTCGCVRAWLQLPRTDSMKQRCWRRSFWRLSHRPTHLRFYHAHPALATCRSVEDRHAVCGGRPRRPGGGREYPPRVPLQEGGEGWRQCFRLAVRAGVCLRAVCNASI